MENTPEGIASFIKEFRKQREWTLREMEDVINADSRGGKSIISYQTILNWENGTTPAMETCFEISKSKNPVIAWFGGVLLEALYL